MAGLRQLQPEVRSAQSPPLHALPLAVILGVALATPGGIHRWHRFAAQQHHCSHVARWEIVAVVALDDAATANHKLDFGRCNPA